MAPGRATVIFRNILLGGGNSEVVLARVLRDDD